MRRSASLHALFASAIIAVLLFPVAAAAKPSSKEFALVPGKFHFSASTTQAGAHADWTTSFDIAHNSSGETFNDVRTTVVELPAGFVGSNTNVPTCTASQLVGNGFGEKKGPTCPAASQVGTISLILTLNRHPIKVKVPVFNVEVTTPGVAAELGFNIAGAIVQTLPVTVRPGDLGLTVTSADIEGVSEPHEISVTVWGIPGQATHDEERGEECYAFTPEEKGNSPEPECINGGKTLSTSPRPFLVNPTRCEAKEAKMRADSWEKPGSWSYAATPVAAATGCERVPFNPTLSAAPTTASAETASGLDLALEVPQTWEKPETLAASNLDDATVTLPRGYTINPSAGAGLQACSETQLAAETAASLPGEGCPSQANIGTVKIVTPLLAEPIEGSVYIAQPYQNPFGSLLAIYIVAKDPARGILVALRGRVSPDPESGQVVTTFDENPEVPFTTFTLHFREGVVAPLVSPQLCGSYFLTGQLSPWSEPLQPRAVSSVPFQISAGVGGGACPSGGTPRFAPSVVTGTQNNDAGGYSAFYLRVMRQDGEQELTRFSTIMPPGLTGNLSGIPFCPDAAVEHARAATGRHELGEPSCPAASQIGHTLVGAGVGSVLAWTPGSVYLAGPYHGAPFSIVSVTSATVGPFDLGTVVIRFALRINPLTAQAEIDATGSDPIPHIIKGIVTHVRDIHVYIDRPGFIINPTSCERMSIANTIDGAGADPSNSADQVPVDVNSTFQAADCQNLQFKPRFTVSTTGKTSKVAGASLNVKLTYPDALQGTQANIHSVKVELPLQLPSRLTTLQKACTEQAFNANPASCPAASIVGHAIATTPILPVPVQGPAYFVSHGGAKFPELIIVLQGYGVTIYLHGETFISKKGITSSTFAQVPDVPVGSFELTLPQGPYSALTASSNLCSLTRTITKRKKTTVRVHGHRRTRTRKVKKTVPASLTMPTSFVAQNGATFKQNTRIAVTGCPRAKAARKRKATKTHSHGKGHRRG